MPDEVINTLHFNFVQPKTANSNITNDLLNNFNTLSEFLTTLYYGQNYQDDSDKSAQVAVFKKELAKDRLAMLNFDHIEEIFKSANIKGKGDSMDPMKNDQSNDENLDMSGMDDMGGGQ